MGKRNASVKKQTSFTPFPEWKGKTRLSQQNQEPVKKITMTLVGSMPVKKNVFEGAGEPLATFGLNKYETSVYRALVGEGISCAKDLSHATGVPYGKVYEILEALAHKGFVLALPTKPAKFQAVSPKNAIEAVKRNLLLSIGQAEHLVLKDLEPVFSRAKELAKPGEGGGFLVIERRSNILDKAEDMIGRAGERVCIHASENGLKRLVAHKNALRAAHHRGVKIMISAPITPANQGEAKSLAFCDIRMGDAGSCSQNCISFDGSEMIFVDAVPDDESFIHGRDTALWSENKALAGFVEKLFLDGFSGMKEFHGGRVVK